MVYVTGTGVDMCGWEVWDGGLWHGGRRQEAGGKGGVGNVHDKNIAMIGGGTVRI